MKIKGIASIIILFALSLYTMSCTKVEQLYVSNGIYDISDIDKDIVYSLKGSWAYAEKEFVSPIMPLEIYTHFQPIEFGWTTYTPPQPVQGYASYAVRIRGFEPQKVYAIHFTRTSSAFTVYLNGNLFYTSGTPGKNFKEEIFDWHADTVILPLNNETEATIVVHLSNFHDRNPGVETPFLFGLYSTLQTKIVLDKLVSSGIFSILFSMATFFISLFLFYRRETTAGLFGLLCYSFAIRTLCYNDFLLRDFFPNVSTNIMYRLGYFTFPFCAVFTFLFILNLFIKKPPKVFYFLTIPLILYGLITLITPIPVFVGILLIVQLYILFLSVIACIVVAYALIKRKPFALTFLISFLLFISAAIFDGLISNGLINAPFISHFGVLLLMIPMAFIVIRHFSAAFKTQEQMIESIQKTNISFQRFFPNEFLQFLNKKNVTDISLGDNIHKNMFIAFIHLGIKAKLSSSSAREELLILYNTVIQAANPIIKKYNGFIDKYLTDGLMVLFYGTAEDTVDCIIEITQLIKKINIHRQEQSLPPLHISSGIHYGKLMMGTIGEPERMDTTVISDVVNISSRMYSYATEKNVNIIISETVREQLLESYWRTHTCFYYGKIKFHGKRNLINVYEVNLL
ncbi:MAG: adenylate/guanylate cyclase domain-containing protein [Treponema sp.]|uniref:Adenylate/guanylate cyclase domain-containing protein n=2 Tax=Treponema TaxID=157 RepID=A0A6P1Y0F9_9SPIR|nr:MULTISPECIES: adenylate/guanylate cyclase domain-containing protein [Treponema]QHX43227.1 adenylate/guanylate cyclase domain-containing protein [Treponema vincentii]UTC52052.1 adenylate/guanylate cyclase domain-containing protein [Treponema sp. OMZ 803]UTC54445.1 adenylate/guanylate cyclase domain-containing protein [Treponema sp. OMZ 906]